MEVEVRVFSENQVTGERKQTSTANLTFVALDDNGKPTPVPKLKVRTEEQKRKFLPPIALGETFWDQAFTEPDAGSDEANMKLRAVPDGPADPSALRCWPARCR